MNDIVVKTEDVVKEYRMGSNILRALDGINIEIERGEYISLMGPSGSGKSTLFNMIGALDRPTEGQVYIDGKICRNFRKDRLQRFGATAWAIFSRVTTCCTCGARTAM